MADNQIDPKSGYCSHTKTFHSLRPPAPLPPPSQPLSIIDYTFSLISSTPTFSPTTTIFLIDASSGLHIYFSEFISQTQSLASSLHSLFPSLSTNQVALILSPSSLHVPILYFALLSLGVTVSPVNPLSTDSELTHLINVSNPVVAFTTSSFAHKVTNLPLGAILLDSPQFLSMLTSNINIPRPDNYNSKTVSQSDTAAILYSSGTTGRVKGVELTHRNFIAIIGDGHHSRFLKLQEDGEEATSGTQAVSLFMLPLFHVFGFFMLIRAAALGDTLVLMERFDFEKMLQAVEKYKVTSMPVSPPLVVAMAKSDLVDKYDISSLELFGCGGAPLGKEIAEAFSVKFPNVVIAQGFGMTESGGGATGMSTPDECEKYGSAGRLSSITEAKIVDPATGEALPPLQQGELWLRGPMIMKGYVGDREATALTLTSEGWLKTGDLCYFDSDGFLYVVSRLKELIKYKAYQVPPAELEHLLQSNPEIADAAVIPYPDEAVGQIPMAYVVRKPGSVINEAQVMEYIAKLVSPYKKIRRVAFISSIPKSPAGKILRMELVNHALSGPSARL